MPDNYEYFYQGSHGSLEPEYGELFIGYRVPASSLGAPTSIETVDQLREVSSRLSEGIKAVEVSAIKPEILEGMPKQHMREINRLAKLTGSETSLHGPVIDPAGFTERGWSESNREETERQLWQAVERSHELSPKGNVPVNLHASHVGVAEYRKGVEGEKEIIAVVNQESGETTGVRREEMFYPEEKKVKILTPEKQVGILNDAKWGDEFKNLVENKKDADDRIKDSMKVLLPIMDRLKKGQIKELTPQQEIAIKNLENAKIFLSDVQKRFYGMYDRAHKYGSEVDGKKLKEIAKIWQEEVALEKEGKVSPLDITFKRSQVLDESMVKMSKINAPQVYKPLEGFALDKAAKTFADLAFKGYEKWRDKAPLITIENPPVGAAFSRAEELKKLIKKSRDEFVKQAIQKGYSSDEARESANKFIGATWDVGHINMLRRYGYGKEEIIKETKKIAPYVKHLHLTDNFGYGDSHLPPGMGEVPTKEMLKELEKTGFKGRAIVEAGGFAAQFKTSPHPYVLEALGSPIYSAMMQPYWSQAQARGGYGFYGTGYGMMLPEQHFSMYGAGFSTLPTELGGQVPGKKSRLTGTPME